MAKVTVSHYLNKKLKPTEGIGVYEGELAYPVYIRISYERSNQRIRSRWIHFDATDREFETDKRIQEVKLYESEIINDIFQCQESCNFNDIGAKLEFYLDDLIELYIKVMIRGKEIIEYILSFISTKTGLNRHVLNPYVRVGDIINYTHNDWYELINKDIFPDSIKNNIVFLALLNEFEDIYYKDDAEDYEVGNILNYHEWKNKGAQKRFLSFASDKALLDNSILNEMADTFSLTIKQDIVNQNWSFLADMTTRNSTKKKQ